MVKEFNTVLWNQRLEVWGNLKTLMLAEEQNIIQTGEIDDFLVPLKDYAASHPNETFDQCWPLLTVNDQHARDLWREVLFDFNRLFVGPDKLQAPPYESVYRDEGQIMGPSTKAVRSYYQAEGLQSNRQGQEPDDHIGIELEFLSYLTNTVLLARKKEMSKVISYYQELYNDFLKKHLLQWGTEFAELVAAEAQTQFMEGIGLYLKAVLKEEGLYVK